MVGDRVVDRAALFLWRVFQWTTLLLLAVVLAALILDVHLPGVASQDAGSFTAHEPIGPGEPGRGNIFSGSGAVCSAAGPLPAPLAARAVPTLVPPTPSPLAPSLPHAGQGEATGDVEAVLGLRSQARWARASSNAAPGARPTGAAVPAPTPVPQAIPSPTAVTGQPPTRIVAPSIGLDARIVPVRWKTVKEGGREVRTWTVPKHNAGWHSTSAPAGGPGNTVLSGHRNIYSEVFRYIVDLKRGDPIQIYAGEQAFVYYVEGLHMVKEVGVPESVRAENARWIARTEDTRLTLITCAPYEAPGNTHRVIVVARP